MLPLISEYVVYDFIDIYRVYFKENQNSVDTMWVNGREQQNTCINNGRKIAENSLVPM